LIWEEILGSNCALAYCKPTAVNRNKSRYL